MARTAFSERGIWFGMLRMNAKDFRSKFTIAMSAEHTTPLPSERTCNGAKSDLLHGRSSPVNLHLIHNTAAPVQSRFMTAHDSQTRNLVCRTDMKPNRKDVKLNSRTAVALCQLRRSSDVFWPDDAVAGPSFTSSVSDDDTVGCCWFCVVRATSSRVRSKISSTERLEEP